MFGYLTVDVYKTFAISRPNLNHETYLTEVGSFSCLAGAFRFVWSWLLDHYSYKRVYGTLLCIQIFLAFTFTFAAKSMIAYAIWVCVAVFCESGHFTLVMNVLKIIYGKHATQLYGVAFSFIGFASFLMFFLLMTNFGHEYIKFWYLTGSMSIMSLIILLLFFN